MTDFAKRISALLVLALLAAALTGCFGSAEVTSSEDESSALTIEALKGSDYYRLGSYKNLAVNVTGEGRADALWQKVLDNVELTGVELPKEIVNQYVESIVEFFKYYASEESKSFDEYVGESEEEFRKSADTFARESIKEELVIGMFLKLGIPGLSDGISDEEYNAVAEKMRVERGLASVAELEEKYGKEMIKKAILKARVVDYIVSENPEPDAPVNEPESSVVTEPSEESSEESVTAEDSADEGSVQADSVAE